MTVLLFTFAKRSFEAESPPPREPVIDAANLPEIFSPTLTKSDRLPIAAVVRPPAQATASVERVLSPPDDPPVAAPARKSADSKPGRQHSSESNVCTRHHLRKVMVGKYKWRCR